MISLKKPQTFYISSLFTLIILAVVCIAISAVDIIIQALTQKTTAGYFDHRNLIVVGGSYVLLVIAATLFSCSRVLTVKSSLQDIPKLYIPIQEHDLPKKVFSKIQQEFEFVKEIKMESEPRARDIQAVGWAKPGTPLFEGLDFKQAIAKTPAFIEKVAMGIDPDFSRPHSVPVRHYFEDLIQQGLVDKQLGEFYLEGYELARFSNKPLTQEYYMELMKHLAAILQNMGFTINHARNLTPQSATDLYSRIGNTDSISFSQSHGTTPSQTDHSEDQYSIYDEEELVNDIYILLMNRRTSSRI